MYYIYVGRKPLLCHDVFESYKNYRYSTHRALTYLPSGQTDFSEIFESYLKPVWAQHVSEHLLVGSDQFFPYITNLSPPLAPCDIEAQHGWPWLLAMKNR